MFIENCVKERDGIIWGQSSKHRQSLKEAIK